HLEAVQLAVRERYVSVIGVRLVTQVVVNVSRNEKVEPSIAVVVAPRSPVRPVAKHHAGFFGHIGKCAVVVVAIEPVSAEVANKNVGPSVVVKVADGHPESPAVIRYTCLGGYIGKCAIVIVVEERCVRWRFSPGECVVGGSVHQVNIEPAVIVIVDKPHTRTVSLKDVLLLGGSHHVTPLSQPGRLCHILENYGSFVHESACGNWTLLLVVYRGEGSRRRNAAHAALRLLRRFHRLLRENPQT